MRQLFGWSSLLGALLLTTSLSLAQSETSYSQLNNYITANQLDSAILSAAHIFKQSDAEGKSAAAQARLDSLWTAHLYTQVWPKLVAYQVEAYRQEVEKLQKLILIAKLLPSWKEYASDVAYMQGYSHYLLAHFNLATDYLNKSIRMGGEQSDNYYAAHTLLAKVHQQTANYYQERINLLEARHWLIKSDSTLKEFNPNSPSLYYYLVNLSQLAEAALNEGKLKQAQTYFRELQLAYKKLATNPYFSTVEAYRQAKSATYQRLMRLHHQQGQADSAAFYFNQAAGLLKPQQAELPELYLSRVQQLLNAKAALEHTEPLLHRARQLNTRIFGKHHPLNARISLLLAEAYLQAGKLALVAAEMDRAREILTRTPTEEQPNAWYLLTTIQSQALMARLLSEQNKAGQAISYFDSALSLENQLRSTLVFTESKELIGEALSQTYDWAMAGAYQAYQASGDSRYLDKAFQYAERSKAAGLREAVRRSQAQQFFDLPAQMLLREKNLQGMLHYYKSALANAPDSSARPQLNQELYRVSQEYHKFEQEVAQRYPKYHQFAYDLPLHSLQEVQQSLGSKEALVEYYQANDYLYVLVISSLAADFLRLELPPPELQSYLQQVKSSTAQSNLAELGQRVFRAVLQPVITQLPPAVNRLVIVPAGRLNYLPFHALPLTTQSYVYQHYATRNEYAATLFVEKSKPSAPAESATLAYAGFAPRYRSELALPHNQREVGFLHKLFGGEPFLNEDASEKNFRLYAPGSQIIHYAGHARASAVPEESGFQFPHPANPDSVNDGFLYLSELYNLPLKAELAILSACETGAGKLSRGEGIISLARAFHYAGCPTVTMTLWKVNDRATATLIELFSQNLDEGMPKDVALQQARIQFMEKEPALSHPYYWAGVVLLGNAESLPAKPVAWYWWGLGILLSLLVLYFIIRLGRSSKGKIQG